MKAKELKQFQAFLEESGAEMLNPTNEWEVVRFRAKGETGVVYQRKNGDLTFHKVAEEAWDAFRNKVKFEAVSKVNRMGKKASVRKRTLLERDGNECFYCGKEMKSEQQTIEHLVSIKHGGGNHIANQFLCHQACNLLAGSLPVTEKIKLRDRLRFGDTKNSATCLVVGTSVPLEDSGGETTCK